MTPALLVLLSLPVRCTGPVDRGPGRARGGWASAACVAPEQVETWRAAGSRRARSPSRELALARGAAHSGNHGAPRPGFAYAHPWIVASAGVHEKPVGKNTPTTSRPESRAGGG